MAMKENKILCAIVAFLFLYYLADVPIFLSIMPGQAEPNLTVENFQDVMKTKTLSEIADKNLNQDLLKERFTGAALQMRTGQYGLAQKGYEDSKVENINSVRLLKQLLKKKIYSSCNVYITNWR